MMGQDGMFVDSVQIREASASLKKNVNDMNVTLDEATQTINGTAASWESAAAENLRARYTSLSAKFTDFYTAINNYATFLDNTAASYEEADKKIEANATELLNSEYNA